MVRATAVRDEDLVELVDQDGHVIGQAARATVHHGNTPRHRAFSVYLSDAAGRVLMTRRALSKLTWPGVWSNSCCGHPRPGETDIAAIHRRVREELLWSRPSSSPPRARAARNATGSLGGR